ncbi:MAG TPA: ThuA domain-containing protein [Cyclobacteriaceae bacterium]|nr:ThuA domain-containing protein [Cyclobacteriaceae bacterium]
MIRTIITIQFFLLSLAAQSQSFKVIGFFTAKNDRAHITFVHEANKWLDKTAKANGFSYDSTNNWSNLNTEFLKNYDVVLFLDTRPDSLEQRKAFEQYMEDGGAWMGFHFAAFALTPSAFPQNWDWYHSKFIGAGEYKSNTWRPTSAVLKVEDRKHPVLKGIPETFKSQPNEWYRWKNDLKLNRDITILLSIDPSSFPLGTGPKQHEIWHEGYYPVMWTNVKYRMIYMNMGHNDIDYEGKTNKQLSSSFGNKEQDLLYLNCLKWLGTKKNIR